VSSFTSVVLPAPFGPTKAIRSPRCTRRSKPAHHPPLTIALADPLRLEDEPPRPRRPLERHPGGAGPSRSPPAAPPASSRAGAAAPGCACAAPRSPRPPTVLPPRSSRSRLCRARSSSSQTLSRHASNSAKPRSSWRISPRSSQSVRRVSARRKARSWLTITAAARDAATWPSSHSIASMSRWLVGSSSSITSGSSASSRASAARRRSPPDAACRIERGVELQAVEAPCRPGRSRTGSNPAAAKAPRLAYGRQSPAPARDSRPACQAAGTARRRRAPPVPR
jgi:hypothetical protein